jgi:hypothetical protein
MGYVMVKGVVREEVSSSGWRAGRRVADLRI